MAKRKLSPKQKAALAKGRKKAAANRKKKAKKKRSKKKATKRKTTKRKTTKRKAKKRSSSKRVRACASLLGKAAARKRSQKARGVRTKALSDSEQKKILNAALRGL